MKTRTQTSAPTPRRLAEAAGRLVSLAAMAILAAPALAQGPSGGHLVHGTGSIQQNGSSTVITAGNGAIFNFQSFNINQGHTVQFLQPGSTSKVLNRITGPDPSRIAGTLTANGIVYIANPAGVFFAQGSLVNVGGIYAAGGKISNADFLAGTNRFTDLRGNVENRGTINSPSVNLVGARVANYGTIYAPSGMVTMAAGDEVYIGEQHGQIFARVSGGATGGTGITQAGTVNAAGGQVRLGAGDMFAMAIDHPGRTTAKDISLEGGRTGIVSVSGTLDASDRAAGGLGGNISVLGDKVGIFGGNLDASGDSGGGKVLVGGNWQGQGPERTATATYLSVDSTVKADAITRGSGGTVVAWSDHVTRAFGNISAKGGAQGGNGGRVETSGKLELQVTKTPDLTASRGQGGLWLIDPHNVTIVAGSGNTGIPGADPFIATGDDAMLGVDLILAALTGGASVSVTTGATGTQDGDITLSVALDFNGTGSNSLTFDAARDIVLDGAIFDSTDGGDTLNLILNAGRDIHANSGISLGGGNLDFNSGGGTAFLNSAAAIEGGAITFAGPVVLEVNTTLIGSTSVTFNSTVDSQATEANDLIVNSPLTAFNGDVGNAAVDTALGLLQTNAAGSTTLNAAAFLADIFEFNDAVILGDDATLTATTSATFNSTVDSQATEANDLIVNSPLTTFNGDVGNAAVDTTLGLFQTDAAGGTLLNAGFFKADTIEFNDAITLGVAVVTRGTTSVTFNSTVDSQATEANGLIVNSPLAFFNGDLGNAAVDTTLGLVQTNAAGTTTLNAAFLKADRFNFEDAIVLGTDVVVRGTTSVTFGSTVDTEATEANGLIVNSPLSFFNGDLGNAAVDTTLGLVQTNAAGTTTLNAAFFKADRFNFEDAIILGTDVVVRGSTSVVFGSTVDSQATEANGLIVNSPLTTFNGSLGNAASNTTLGLVQTNAAGTTTLNAAFFKADRFNFEDAVVLGTNVVVRGSTSIAFGSTIDSEAGEANNLILNSPLTTLGGNVGSTGFNTNLGLLQTNAAGTTTLFGSSYIADRFNFEDALVLENSATISGAVSVVFGSTIDSAATEANDLTVNSPLTTFNGSIGAATGGALGALQTDAAGATTINAAAINAATLDFLDALIIATNTTLTGTTSASFGSTINSQTGQTNELTINSPMTSLAAAIGATDQLALFRTTGGGTTTLDGDITARRIDFGNALVLGSSATLTGATSIVFRGTVDSQSGEANDLTLDSPVTNFNGQVGNAGPTTALGVISTDPGTNHTTTINTAVMKAAELRFEDAVILAFSTALTADVVRFGSAVDSRAGQARTLTVNSPDTFFNGVVGGGVGGALGGLTTDAAGTTVFNAGAVTAATMNFGDAVILAKSSVFTGTTSVAFNSTLNSESGEANNLTINSPLTSFGGAVGGGPAGELGTLATDGPGTTTINTGIVNAATMIFDDAVVLGVDTVISGTTAVTFNSTVDSQSSEANDLTVNSPNTVFAGAIGAATNGALGALSTDDAGSTQIQGAVHAASVNFADALAFSGGTISTTGDQFYGGPLTIGTTTILAGANLTFDGTINSISADRALTINSSGSGTTRFNAAIGGGITPLASITTNADGQTIFAGGPITTSGDQTYNDVVLLAVDTVITGSNIIFGETINSGSTARSLAVNTTGNGTTTFSRAVGASSVLTSLSTNSDGTTRLNGGTVTTTGTMAFNNNVILGADTTLDGQSVAFGGTLDSDINTRNLTVFTHGGGVTDFVGAVGAAQPLRTINTNADGTTQFFGGTVRTTGNQNYRDAVVLGANTSVIGANIAFFSSIDSTALLSPASLTVGVTGSGFITLRGPIGATNALSSITTDTNGTTRIGGNITTSGGTMTFRNALRFFGDSTLTDTGGSGLFFGSTIDSEGSARNLSLIVNTSSNASTSAPGIARIILTGAVGGASPLQSLTLGGDRLTNPAAATIGAGLNPSGVLIPSYNLSITTLGDFTMGQRQKLAVVGSLTVNAGGTATLGDISTLGSMTISAPAIVINTRPGGANLENIGTVASPVLANTPDLGVDFVAGSSINFSTTPTITGGFSPPAFATPGSSNISSTLMDFTNQASGPLTERSFHAGVNYLDVRAQGPSNTNVGTAIAGALPTQTQSGIIMQDTSVGRAQQQELALMGISARTLEQRQLMDFLLGRAFYLDVAPALGAGSAPVTINRLPAALVTSTLEAYRAVFWRDGLVDAQRPGRVLGQAWKEYAAAAGDRADALGFRAYCEAVPAQAEAIYYLNALRDLFAELGNLGLSPGELRVAKNTILRTIAVPGLPATQLEAAILATNLGPTE